MDMRSLPRSHNHLFHPVMQLSTKYEVLDLTTHHQWNSLKNDQSTHPNHSQIGKFNEVRSNLYEQPLFKQGESPRCVHMGIDLGGLVGTSVHSFDDGLIYDFGKLPELGDYGHTIIIEYIWQSTTPLPCGSLSINKDDRYWALYGHLSAQSIKEINKKTQVKRGQIIGWLGSVTENGGWPPHLHFQLSRLPPLTHDLPGAVTLNDRAQALDLYPDPREILGPLY